MSLKLTKENFGVSGYPHSSEHTQRAAGGIRAKIVPEFK